MKIFRILLLFGAVACHDDQKDCIDPDLKKDTACYEIYAPVCGCNGKTYSNDCFAANAGVKSWTKGACE